MTTVHPEIQKLIDHVKPEQYPEIIKSVVDFGAFTDADGNIVLSKQQLIAFLMVFVRTYRLHVEKGKAA